MKIFNPFKRNLENPKMPITSSSVLANFGGVDTLAGEIISEKNALSLSAVYSAISRISESFALIDIFIEQETSPNVFEKAKNLPVYSLLNYKPNNLMTPVTFLQTMMGHVLTYGNAFAFIHTDNMGQPTRLDILQPNSVCPEVYEDGTLTYSAKINGRTHILPSAAIFHIKNFSLNGIMGESPILLNRETLGLSKAAQKFGATFFGKGASLGGVLMHPKTLSHDAKMKLKQSWDSLKGGGFTGVAVLEEDLKYERIGIPPDDAQFLETRKFQVEEVARIWRIPPHLIAQLDNATFSNITEQSIEFLRYTLNPWVEHWHDEIRIKLLNEIQAQKYNIRFDTSKLVRPLQAERYAGHVIAINAGFKTRNEVRIEEGLPPLAGLDEILTPLNMFQKTETKSNTEPFYKRFAMSLQRLQIAAQKKPDAEARVLNQLDRLIDDYLLPVHENLATIDMIELKNYLTSAIKSDVNIDAIASKLQELEI